MRDAILRYEVKHPVINDDRMLVWRSMERKSWPSIMIISPKGVPILIINGEGYRDVLDLFISIAFDYYYDKMNHKPTITWEPEVEKAVIVKRKLALEAKPEE